MPAYFMWQHFYKLFNYSQGPKDSSVSLLHRQNKTGLGIFLKSHFSFLPWKCPTCFLFFFSLHISIKNPTDILSHSFEHQHGSVKRTACSGNTLSPHNALQGFLVNVQLSSTQIFNLMLSKIFPVCQYIRVKLNQSHVLLIL